MMLTTRTSRKASVSSPSQSVGRVESAQLKATPLILLIELELDEEGTRISLTIVDTPGFGDQIDNEARYVCSVGLLWRASS
jgi:septin family protein